VAESWSSALGGATTLAVPFRVVIARGALERRVIEETADRADSNFRYDKYLIEGDA
jgi:hypothetical protein